MGINLATGRPAAGLYFAYLLLRKLHQGAFYRLQTPDMRWVHAGSEIWRGYYADRVRVRRLHSYRPHMRGTHEMGAAAVGVDDLDVATAPREASGSEPVLGTAVRR